MRAAYLYCICNDKGDVALFRPFAVDVYGGGVDAANGQRVSL